MAIDQGAFPASFALGRKLVFLAAAMAIVGLPINHLSGYALILVVTVIVCASEVTSSVRRWLAAAVLVLSAILGQSVLDPPRIEEGHNVFLPDSPRNVLATGLPPEVYRLMAAEFDALYPPARRCDPRTAGCWRGQGFPDRAFAFSTDGIFDKPAYSRRVDSIDFGDPVWLRLGFINDARYKWYFGASDIQRFSRDKRFWMGLHRWHLTMPWFVMYRFPSVFAGGDLCWQGDMIWEERNEQFVLLKHQGWACRTIERDDIGHRIFGVAIRPDTLAINFYPPIGVRAQRLAAAAIAPLSVIVLIGLLLRWSARRSLLPFMLIGISLLAIVIDDASFIGGMRPFDGGDDGLYYDSVARRIVADLLNGSFAQALEGGERVFYYGGPGLRYLRALEHFIFGETYLGYLSLILFLPIMVLMLFRRFLPARWAIVLSLGFVALPIGALFGTSFFQYAKWASRGFADPAAAIAALGGLLLLVGPRAPGRDQRFAPASGAAFLFALAIFIRPNVAPFVGVMLAGAGLAALHVRQWPRLAGLCVGFLPVTVMALHNWYFGGVFVPFSANSTHPLVFVMPPSAYVEAAYELMHLNFGGQHLSRAVTQIVKWLSGPSEFRTLVPLHAAALVIVLSVALRGRGFDPWLRLTAAATLAQHAVSLFYVATPRYQFLAWLLTFLVTAVWFRETGVGLLKHAFPFWWKRIRRHPLNLRFASAMVVLQRSAGWHENERVR